MTIYLTPITRFSISETLPLEPDGIRFGDLILRSITDEEFRQHLHISDRSFNQNEFGCTKHSIERTGILNDFQEFELCRSSHAFISQLPIDEHQAKVIDILHCWRLLRMCRVACPVTFKNSSPGLSFQRPVECNMGGSLQLDKHLLNLTYDLLPEIKKIPSEDLNILDMVNESVSKALAVFLLVVIIERSLMKGERSEISFKVSVYGSKILDHLGILDSRSAFFILRKAYKFRSIFVHDGKTEGFDFETMLPLLYDFATAIRRHTALNPASVSQTGKDDLLFPPTMS